MPYTASDDRGSYIEHLPPTYTGRAPMPLVVDLHGWSEPAAIQVQASNWGTYGDTHGFITVTPQVNYSVPHWDTTLGSHDLTFVGDLLTHVEQTLCVDQRRIFVTGYSDGAFMTSAVACQFADRVAAVGMVAGIQNIPGCHPARRVPAVAFHGTADPYVPYLGGYGKAALNLPAANGSGETLGQELKGTKLPRPPSIPSNTAAWAKRNGCHSTPTLTTAATGVTLIRYSCPAGATVELYRISGGGHAWPGSEFTKSVARFVGYTTFAINADDIMFHFFQSHPLPASLSQAR